MYLTLLYFTSFPGKQNRISLMKSGPDHIVETNMIIKNILKIFRSSSYIVQSTGTALAIVIDD